MIIKFKNEAKFGNFESKCSKFNRDLREMRRRHSHTNGKMSECKLRGMSFHHYGNPSQNSNYFPFKSTNDIIYQIVRDFWGVKIMILYNHDSHNEFA